MGFAGSDRYLASRSLSMAVNAAIVLEKPLLIKGEPGTGKTVLAEAVAESLGADLISWHIKSTTKAQQGLYEYDAVARLRDSQLGDPRVGDISHYIRQGKLWQAFAASQRPVLLIDDLLATGGTMDAACKLIAQAGAKVHSCAVLVELTFLKGRERLAPHEVFTLIRY